MTKEQLLADIRNKMTPASHLISLVEIYFNKEDKTGVEQRELFTYIKESLPKAKQSIEYLRSVDLKEKI